jgi:hypothetical protein
MLTSALDHCDSLVSKPASSFSEIRRLQRATILQNHRGPQSLREISALPPGTLAVLRVALELVDMTVSAVRVQER